MIMSPNSVEIPAVLWGCHFAGGVVAPVNPDLSASELKQQLVRSRAKALVVHSNFLETAIEALRLAGIPKEYLLSLSDNTQDIQTVKHFIREASNPAGEILGPRRVAPDDLAYLVYSSGTTGHPKGVMISHRNVVAAVLFQAEVEGFHTHWRTDRTLAVLPVYHIYGRPQALSTSGLALTTKPTGLICLIHLPMWLGIRTIFMEKFEVHSFCQIVQDFHITHSYVAPPIVLHLAKNSEVDKYDLSSLNMMTSGGAPLATALIRELYRRRQLPVRQAYGLSETTSVSHIQVCSIQAVIVPATDLTQRRDDWQACMGSNGPPFPGLEAKYVRSDGRAAAINKEGELWVRGPTIFRGYRDEPDMTAECLTADGWFKTGESTLGMRLLWQLYPYDTYKVFSGDVGYEDAQHNLFITDRSKDMIKFKGYQVAPVELEDILLQHPVVKDAAVIGVMNEDLQSEVPLAYITPKEGSLERDETAVEILNYVKSKVIHYKRLRGGIIWASTIPRSASGKILKRVLRDRAGGADKGKQIGAVAYEKYRHAKL